MRAIVRMIARRVLPRPVLRRVRKWRAPLVRYSDGYESWQAASIQAGVYDEPAVVGRTASAAREVQGGRAAYERDAVLLPGIEYAWPVLAGFMYGAALGRGRLSVLDFGGALGSTYMQNRRFLRGLEVDWRIVELPGFASAGRAEFETPSLRFFDSLDAALAGGAPGVIHLGGSLQFVERPFDLLERLARIPHDLLLLDRTPFTAGEDGYVCVQHVRPPMHDANWPFHVFAADGFEARLRAWGWTLLERFGALEGERETDSGRRISFRGMILVRDGRGPSAKD